MYRFMRYVLTASVVLLSTETIATVYTIGGSSQPLVVYNSSTATFNDNITVPGSNFTMFSPVTGGVGKVLVNPDTPAPYSFSGTTEDVVGTFDDALICFDTSCTNHAMSFSSVTNFSGAPWTTSNIRVFGPGTYDFDTCLPDGSTSCIQGGDPTASATLEVGPGKVGAQVFFDWSGNANIDVFLLWQPAATYTRPTVFAGFSDAETRTYALASRDVDGDGNAGSNMTDGPFKGHNASFSLFLDQPLAVPTKPTMDIIQSGNAGAASGIISLSSGPATIDTGITAAANLVFDWNLTSSATTPKYANGNDMYPASDAALVAANLSGTTSEVFTFDPSSFVDGDVATASVRVTNIDNGLSHGATVTLTFGCPVSSAPLGQDTDSDGIDDNLELCGDADGDGIVDYLDPDSLLDTQTMVDLPAGTVANTDNGKLLLGSLAKLVPDINGDFGTGIAVSASDIGITDTAFDQSCVGGCFDFTVTGGSLGGTGTSASVVVPLSAAIPERAVYRKVQGGQWVSFDDTAVLDSVNSAASVAGVCPAPGDAAYANGLVVGDDCLQITIEDNGPNDSNANAGAIADPGGIAQEPAPKSFSSPTTKLDGGVFGCSASNTPVKLTERGELMLIFAFIAWLGFARRKKHKA